MKRVPITGTTLTLILLFLSTFLSTAFSQSLLIQPLEGIELTPEEADRKATAEALPFAGENALIEIGNLAESFGDDVLQAEFPLIDCGTLTLETIHSEYESEGNYRWYGRITDDLLCECREGFLLLISEKGQKFGHLELGAETYDIAQLSEDRHLMTRSDFPPALDEECGVSSSENPPEEQGTHGQYGQSADERTNEYCEVRVLALYNASTVAAEGDVWRVRSRISMAMTQTNMALANSRVRNTRLVLAAVDSIPGALDSLPGSIQLDSVNVIDLRSIALSQNIRNMRNAVGADIVAFVTGTDYKSSTGGESRGVTLSLTQVDSLAYILVETGHATTGKYTFAHEMGHIFGCRHQVEYDDFPGIPHGHVFDDAACNERNTVMNLVRDSDSRILHYSNPRVKFAGRATGTYSRQYNAEQFRSTACTVAQFRDTLNPPLRAYIGGEVEGCPCESLVQTAVIVSGTPGTYSFEWRTSTDGVNYGPVVSTSQIYAVNLPCDVGDRIFIKLTVSDASGNSVTAFGSVRSVNDHPSGLPCARFGIDKDARPLSKIKVYPNPAEHEVFIELTNQQKGRIKVFDAIGKEILNVEKTAKRTRLAVDDWPSGIYTCQFIGEGGNPTSSNFIISNH